MYKVPDELLSLQQSYLDLWKPSERLNICDWSEQNIFLSERNSPNPGLIHLWPYQRGLLEAMGDPELSNISVMKPSRIGYSKTMLCVLAHYAANAPSSVALLLPTTDDCRKMAIFEVNPLFAESPILQSLLRPSSPGPRRASEPDNDTLVMKLFAGSGSLRILSAGSPRMLRSSDIKVLLADEADAFAASPEGDALELGIKRTLSHYDRKIIVGSSPTFEGASIIERRYNESDRRVYEIPCIHCESFFELLWSHIHYPPDDPSQAFCVCPSCHEPLDEKLKSQMVDAGRWRITRPEVKGHAGFRLNALISMFENCSWDELACEYERAKRAGPSLLQVFYNTALGLPYKLQIDAVDQSFLRSKAEDFGLDNMPEQVLLLTVGIDVQMSRLELLFVGFALDGSVFILGHRVLHGSTQSGAPVWRELDNLLAVKYRHPRGYELGVECTCIDSGGTGQGIESRTQAVYDFTRPRWHKRIYAIKAIGGSRPVWQQAQTTKGNNRLFLLGIDSLKTDVLAGLAAMPFIDGDGECTQEITGIRNVLSYRISNSLSDVALEQLTNEGRYLATVKGREVMIFRPVKVGARTECLDACCYGLGARAAIRNIVNMRQRAERSGTTSEAQKRTMSDFHKLGN